MKKIKNQTFKKVNLVLILLLMLASTVAIGQSKAEQIDELISKYTEYGKFNGSALVARDGKVIFKKGYGMANMEWDIPNASNTKHRLGSITKQFTAMLILQLASEGKIDLNKPVNTYLPDYSEENGDKFTTHQLLTHTAGVPNYTAFPRFFQDESRNPYTPDEFVEMFADSTLDFEPGDKFTYSNSGYFLLGVLVEKITGKPYEEVLQENIFDPLGMKDSGYDHHDEIMKNRATGYEKNGNSYVNSAYLDMSIPYAAGSLYSTTEDLLLWDQALYSNKLLPKKYMDLLFEPYIPAFGNSHYAYGWAVGNSQIGKSKDSVATIGHGGGINGFNTLITRMPTDRTLVVLLNNTGGAPLNSMTRAISGILYNKEYSFPKQSVANSLLSAINEKGIASGIAHYNKIKDSESYNLSENEMNNTGYQLLQAGKVDEATAVFKLNVEAFPKSFNAYDSYAEGLMGQGNNEQAIVNYKKSVELNPANQNGIDYLIKLGVKEDELKKDVVVADAILETYVGRYQLMPNFVIEVRKDGSTLITQATGQPEFEIFPKAENVFYLKVVNAQLTFNKGESGTVDSVTLFQGGQEIIGKKIVE